MAKAKAKATSNTITHEQYMEQLHNFVASQMNEQTNSNHTVEFWANFNNECQIKFDAQLSAQGITVV